MAEGDPRKQKMEYIAIGVLVVVALFIGMGRFKKKGGGGDVLSRDEFSKKWEEVEVLETNLPKEEEKVHYTAEVERIPFRSPYETIKKAEDIEEEEVVELPPMSFEGMVWNSARPQAIINGTVYDIDDKLMVGEGESASYVRVKAITKDGILLEYKRRGFLVRPK